MHCIIVGLNIKSAPIDVLERLSVHHARVQALDQELKDATGVDGAVVLNTCNRFEIYATCDDAQESLARIRAFLYARGDGEGAPGSGDLDALLYSYVDDDAVRHLLEVVSGLDSLILGEAEILGQVSRAYKAACQAGTTDKLINVWFQRSLRFGKRVRTETSLGRHPVSIGHIAVDLALREVGGAEGKRALIIGAGEVGELTAKYLLAYRFPIVMVANRSLCKARELAGHYGIEACYLSTLEQQLEEVDLVFSATSAKRFVVDADAVARVMARRPDRPLLFVDMALPRDVDPAVADIEGVSLYNINELRGLADRNRVERALAAEGVRRLIEGELVDFNAWMQSLAAVPVITALRKHAESIKRERLAAAFEKLPNLTPSERHAVEVLATTITDRFVRAPVEALHDQCASQNFLFYAETIKELFDLDVEVNKGSVREEEEQANRQAV
ncbi:hypothetical protein JI75_04670 [Berryella intestinalis]|uniref:Glutamyl-tRNA reductase n=1 Tax=Berryella intestinalis TaxID=1531429 RepID=A0A0A8B3N3_9ACTN|nr:glutamyl-tRNA reductase [Berryella intestinalis]AJC12066.1 hypothetical protein JI75_04670 [Berryella intestinalis]